jgi:hypothetical protein
LIVTPAVFAAGGLVLPLVPFAFQCRNAILDIEHWLSQ